MKTLDEVIKTFDGCFLKSRKEWCIENCPYLQNDEQMCRRDVLIDALHYLKEYRDSKATIADAMERHSQAALRHMDEADKLAAQRFVMEYDNPPLTWEQLTQMEGKPVWVETDNEKFWIVVDNFRTICNQECLCCSKGYMCRSTYARGDWQAYRKERK